MVSARVELYCERCGSPLVLASEVPATYCAGCRMYLCATCRGADDNQCRACISRGAAGSPLSGIGGARRAVRDVQDALTDLARVRTALTVSADPDRPPDAAIREWQVVRVRADAAARAAEAALQASRPRYPFKADRLETELAYVRKQIERVIPDPPAYPPALAPTSPPPAPVRSPESLAARLRRTLPPVVIVAAVVTVVLIIAIAALALSPDTATDTGLRVTPFWI